MSSSASVVVVGDILIDELLDPAGSTVVPGGSALNVAVGLAVLDTPAILIGAIGEDEAGERIRRYLDSWRVPLLATHSALGTGWATSDRRGGEPTYRFNEAAQQRHIDFTPSVVDAFAAADLVAVSGFPFDVPEQAESLAAALSTSKARIAIDANPRSGLLHDRLAFRQGFERFAQSATLVKLGDDDARLLYDRELDSVVATFQALGAHSILATAGERGASIYGPGFVEFRPIAAGSGPIVDTMGAGDAVFATALVALAAGDPGAGGWGAVLDDAMTVASETIRHPGALLRQRSVR